jgi:16S rRNA G527 N7-methylase RsmG
MKPIISDERIKEIAQQTPKDAPCSVAVLRALYEMRDEYEYIIELMRQEINKLQEIIEEHL